MENTTEIPKTVAVNFDNLLPALISCFGITFLGYISGRMNIITDVELKGMNTFVRIFVLPSLIFVNMVKMNMATVNWYFLLAILIAKSLIFLVVFCVHVIVFRPINIPAAGLLAIFCTQSNDFALGYPIVDALYKNTHPDFAGYMYLMAPINLAILNPIAFFMMETKANRETMEEITSSCRLTGRNTIRMVYIVKVLKKIYTNPIIFMTVLGILANFIFKQHLPEYLNNILMILGQAFSACALFALGMRMVGKLHTLRGAKLLAPCLLILVKLLLLPLLIRETVNILDVGKTNNDTVDWSTFGFLYGTIPSAPTIFVFAIAYNLEVDLVATTMVACTFVSGPWMFVSAKMITLPSVDPSEYYHRLNEFISDVSIVSLLASVWVLFVFVLTKRLNKVPHKFVACLVFSQILSCAGAILYRFVDMDRDFPSYLQFLLFTTGVYSGRLWTAIISMTLLFMESRSLCFILFKLQPFFYIFGWGLPLLLSVLLLCFDTDKNVPYKDRNPNFAYGTFQAIAAVFLLVLCFIVGSGCLLLYEMHKRQKPSDLLQPINNGDDFSNNDDDEEENRISAISPINASNTSNTTNTTMNISNGTSNRSCGLANCCNSTLCKELPLPLPLPTICENGSETPITSPISPVSPMSPIVDIEDLFNEIPECSSTEKNLRKRNDSVNSTGTVCRSGLYCNAEQNEACHGIVLQYQEPIDEDLDLIEEESNSHDPQTFRHFVLVIVLLSSMLIGLAIAIWTLVMEKMSGIYIELAFIDASLQFGQSIIVFTIFGIDNKYILLPLSKKLRKFWYKDVKLLLPMLDELSPETKHICEQFKKYHQTKCVQDIASNKIYRLREYENVFTGKQLIDWLVEIGLCQDRSGGTNYARHLIEGRVLRHINDVYHFYDRNLLYTFN